MTQQPITSCPSWCFCQGGSATLKAPKCATQAPVRPLPADFPNPNYQGPCSVRFTFACSDRGFERLNPLAMLPNATVTNRYTLICQTCYDALALVYMRNADPS